MFPKYFVLLQRYLPFWLRNPNRRDEPLGGALHIEKVLLTLCFWSSKLPLSNAEQKQMQGDCHGVCISGSVVCCEDRVSSMHTLRCTIYSSVGVYSVCFSAWLWKASKTNRQMLSTTFFVCSSLWSNKQSDFRCLSEHKE